MTRTILLILTLAFATGTPTLGRQDEGAERLFVRVTSAAGQSVFIDKGSVDGVAADQLVHFLDSDDGSIHGVVRDVASRSARVEFPAGTALPPLGALGEIRDARPPAKEDESGAPPPPPVEHPPWTSDLPPLQPGEPLLAPAYGQPSTARRPEIRGRIYSRLRLDRTSSGNHDSTYGFASAGAWIEATNPFGRGGRLLLDASLDLTNVDVLNTDTSDVDFILQRASYAVGGETYAPYRLEVGRFYSVHVPELGLLDGVEGTLQFENGVRAGGGAGFIPRPTVDLRSGEDFGVHAFIDYSASSGRLDATLAYQKTWYEGSADRDQVIGRVQARPTDALWLYAFMRLDLYSGDDLKGDGVEVTDFSVLARYAPTPDWGASISYSHTAWPELLRDREQPLGPALVELLVDGSVDRVDLSGWFDISDAWRFSGRVNGWRDHRTDGLGGSLAMDWLDPRGRRPTFRGELFYLDGAFNSGPGVRLRSRYTIGSVGLFAQYEFLLYDSIAPVDAGQDVIRHTIRGGVDWRRGHWYYGLEGDIRTEDALDSYGIGAFIEYRF
ncbi:MAG: hypothetical protein ACYTGR_20250 [Planctomycetota bacterium]